ncbi:MAG: tetratricopeptide repeat protein [Kofleriaceae bacterium]
MRTRSWGLVVATAVMLLFGSVRSAHADAKGDIQAKSKAAMDSYDQMDYDAAKKQLNQALTIAKRAKLDKDPAVARVYLQLGITQLASGDQEAARLSLLTAVQLDAKIQIDAAYKSSELTKLLDEAKSSIGGEPAAGDDCASVTGVQHTIIDTGRAGAAQPIELLLGSDIKPARVSVMYRSEGATEFTEGRLVKQGGCKYTGQIPATAMHGSLVHYYVGAFDANNRLLAGKGSAGAPNLLELTTGGPVASASDTEDPITGARPGGSKPSGGDIVKGVVVAGKRPKIMFQVAGGTGFGYVTGNTEGGGMVEKCCLGTSLLVVTPELGYNVTRRLAISLAARIGLPIGANVEPHATVAPGGMIRVRYTFSDTGSGIRLMGQVGGGVMRNTIKLEEAEPGMDTDIVAQGPLLVGAGLGYVRKLSSSVSFVADVSALAGIAVVDKLGTSVLNTGVGADVSLGLSFGF